MFTQHLPPAVFSFSEKFSSFALASKARIILFVFSSGGSFFQENVNANLSFAVCRKRGALSLYCVDPAKLGPHNFILFESNWLRNSIFTRKLRSPTTQLECKLFDRRPHKFLSSVNLFFFFPRCSRDCCLFLSYGTCRCQVGPLIPGNR